jgi:hypothetical protein
MNPTDPVILLLSVIVTAILLGIIAFFTRATWRRFAAAVIVSLPIIPLVMFFDFIAARLRLWHYPSVTSGQAPFAWYIAAALFYGAGLGLIGWRVIRRFGKPGLILFLVAFGLFGVSRDYLYSINTDFIKFGNGLIPLVADFFSYTIGAIIVQALMVLLAGKPSSDRLARMKAPKSFVDN